MSGVSFGGGVSGGNWWNITPLAGSLYLTHNATYDGTNWNRTDINSPAWMWQFNISSNMIFESYKASTFWVAQPGENPIGNFTAVGGWEMITSYSQFKDMTIGGNGAEIDGNGTTPYGRVRHATINSAIVTELVRNAYLDDSGRDNSEDESWAAGLYNDSFQIRRAPANGDLTWSALLQLLSGGQLLLGLSGDFNSDLLQANGNVSIVNPGSGLKVREGANAKQGTAVLVAGTVTVSNTSVTANSRIFLTAQNVGGTPGALYISAREAGTSFTITSTSSSDTSTIAYEIFEPS